MAFASRPQADGADAAGRRRKLADSARLQHPPYGRGVRTLHRTPLFHGRYTAEHKRIRLLSQLCQHGHSTEKFKAEAVQMLLDGQSATSFCERLGLSGPNLLYAYHYS